MFYRNIVIESSSNWKIIVLVFLKKLFLGFMFKFKKILKFIVMFDFFFKFLYFMILIENFRFDFYGIYFLGI